MKKEITYIMDCATEDEILKAEKLQRKLYEKYNEVMVYPNGLCKIKIIARDKIKIK